MQFSTEVLVISGLMVLAILFLMAMLARMRHNIGSNGEAQLHDTPRGPQ